MGADQDGDQVVPAGRTLDHGDRDLPDGRTVALGKPQAVLSQDGQALASGDESDVVPGLTQAGGEQAPGNPGTVHEDFHGDPSFSHTFV